jgi:hypothetical protein
MGSVVISNVRPTRWALQLIGLDAAFRLLTVSSRVPALCPSMVNRATLNWIGGDIPAIKKNKARSPAVEALRTGSDIEQHLEFVP